MSGAQSKAANFTYTVESIRALAKPGRFAQMLQELPAPTRRLIDEPPLAIGWVDIEHTQALFTAATRTVFDDDTAPFYEVGRRTIYASFTTIHRAVMRFASPHYVIRRVAVVWASYSKNGGNLQVTREDEHAVEVLYEDMPFGSAAAWQFRRGGIAGALEATGARGVTVVCLGGADTDTSRAMRAQWR